MRKQNQPTSGRGNRPSHDRNPAPRVQSASDSVGRPGATKRRTSEVQARSADLRPREQAIARPESFSVCSVRIRLRRTARDRPPHEKAKSTDLRPREQAVARPEPCSARSVRIRLRRTARSDVVTERACERRNEGAQVPPRRGAEAPQRGVWGANEIVLRCDGPAPPSIEAELHTCTALPSKSCDGPPRPSHRSPATDHHGPPIEALRRTTTALPSKSHGQEPRARNARASARTSAPHSAPNPGTPSWPRTG